MLKRLMALIIGVSLIVATSIVAFGGPVEVFFYEKNYTSAVYDILVTHEITVDEVTLTTISYGQGLAIGPHYILTAAHVISPETSVTFLYTQPAEDKILKIEIVAHHTWTTDSGFRSSAYEYFEAEVVEQGSKAQKDFENDWAILHVKDLLGDYIICNLWLEMGPGDNIWNITGNIIPQSYAMPYVIVGTELQYYEAIYEFGTLTLFKTDPMDVYVAYPTAVQGDSGSPVFDEYGNLIGIMVGGGRKLSVICKAERFKTAFEKYVGK